MSHPARFPFPQWTLLALLLVAGCSENERGFPGYVEGEYLYIAAPTGGRLETRHVERGGQVSAGDSLFQIERSSERAALDEAEHRQARARAAYMDLASGKRPEEISVIQSQLVQAAASARLAQTRAERAQGLHDLGSIPESDLDEALAERDRALARVEELEASIASARLPGRTGAVRAAEQEYLAAEAAVRRATVTWAEKAPTAPAQALVQEVFYQVGEWVPAGSPVVSLLPPESRKVRFFVPETVIASLSEGQPVWISCDACPDSISAIITYVAPEAEFTPPVIYSLDQRAKLVFRVEARPDTDFAPLLRPGLPVNVTISQEENPGLAQSDSPRGATADDRPCGTTADDRPCGATADDRPHGAIADERPRGAVADDSPAKADGGAGTATTRAAS